MRNDISQLVAFYDDRYFQNLDLMLDEPGYKYVKKIISKIVISPERKGKVIDIGCGTGWLLKLLENSELSVVGLDFSSYSLKKAKVLLKKTSNLIAADSCHLPFRYDIFEQVVSTWLIEHVQHPEKALDEMYRVLRSKGTAVIMAPTPELHSNKFRIPKIDSYQKRGDEHFSDFSPHGLEFLIKKASFIITERRGIYRPNAINIFTFPAFKIFQKNKLLSNLIILFNIYFILLFFPYYFRFNFFYKIEMMLSNKVPFNIFGIETIFTCYKYLKIKKEYSN